MPSLLLVCWLWLGVPAPETDHGDLEVFTFSQLDSLQAVEARKVLVFLHTDWCKYCRQMENTTFRNEEVVKALNQQFYFISLDGESREDIRYAGHTFKYKPTGGSTGVHELAEQIGTVDGKLSYPTVAVLNPKNELVFQYGGLMKTRQLLTVLEALSKS